MRSFVLLLSLLTLLALTGCGTEKELVPPAFTLSDISTELLNRPSNAATVVLVGTLDDPAATVEVEINGSEAPATFALAADGSWTLTFVPVEGTNTVSLTASDERGNLNKLSFSLIHDSILPTVTATSPAAGATVTTSVTEVTVTFSEALAAEPTKANFLIEPTVINLVTYDAATRTATLTLATPLANGEQTVNFVGPFTDLAGNPLIQMSFTFTVAVPAP